MMETKNRFFELCETAKPNVIKQLVKYGIDSNVDVNWCDSLGTGLHRAIRARNYGVVNCLIELNIDIHAKDCYGDTALHIAIESNDFQTVKLLIKLGANINDRTYCGSTPLHLAAGYNRLTIVAYLLDCGADTTVINNSKKTASDIADDFGSDIIASHIKNHVVVPVKGVMDG